MQAERPKPNVDLIMSKMGFSLTSWIENPPGPYTKELRVMLQKKIGEGMVSMSGGTWWGPVPSDEERARSILAMQWEVDNGHTTSVRSIDGPFRIVTDVRTMKRHLRIRWKSVPGWILDKIGLALLAVRVFWARKVLKRVNPYVEVKK